MATTTAKAPATKRRGRTPRTGVKDNVATVDTATGNVESIVPAEEHKEPQVKPEELAAVAASDETPENVQAPVVKKEPKERRMKIFAHFVPGKSATAGLTPDALEELAFVSTYSSTDPQSTSQRLNGYQREPMEDRFPGIGRYYSAEGKSHLIPNIIVNVRVYSPKEQAEFNTLFNKGDITAIHKQFGKDVFSVVDGQHRKGGLYWAWLNKDGFNPDVPVSLYYGLRYTEEAELFDEINTNQRRLPKALIESTRLHLESGEKTHRQMVREIAAALAQDGNSVWHGLVNMTGQRRGTNTVQAQPISFEGMRRSAASMMPEKTIQRLQKRGLDPANVAKKYWEVVSRACSDAWTNRPRFAEDETGETIEVKVKYQIKDLAGVAAISKLGNDIINTSLDKSKTHADFWSAVADMVSKLGQVDWAKEKGNPWTASGAGFAGMAGLYDILYDAVYLDKLPGVAANAA